MTCFLIIWNFYRIVLNVCYEARFWERLNCEVPAVIQSVYNKWDQLKLKYETVLTIVVEYNKVIEGKIYLNMHYMHVCLAHLTHIHKFVCVCVFLCVPHADCPIQCQQKFKRLLDV